MNQRRNKILLASILAGQFVFPSYFVSAAGAKAAPKPAIAKPTSGSTSGAKAPGTASSTASPSKSSSSSSSSSSLKSPKEEWEREFGIGLDLTDKGEFSAAEEHFRKTLKLIPTKEPLALAGIKQELGTALYQQGKYEEALDEFIESTLAFQKSPERHKDDLVLGYEMLSRTCRHLGRPSEAEDFGLKAVNFAAAIHGKNSLQYAYNLRNMGKFYIGMYRYLDAEDVLKKAVAIFEASKNMDQEQLAVCIDFLWLSLEEQGKTEEAEKLLPRIREFEKKYNKSFHWVPPKFDPNKSGAFASYLAAMRYTIKRNWSPPKSSEDCRAIVSFKIHSDGKISDAKIECPSGDQQFDENCLETLKKAFAHPIFLPKGSPENVDISFTFEKTIRSGSDVSAASEKRIDPVAVALKLMDKHNYKEAKAILSMPDLASSVKANVALCRIALKLKKAKEAETHSRKVISLDSNNVEGHMLCADALAKQLNFADAVAEYKKVLELHPNSEDRTTATSRIAEFEADLKEGGSVYRAQLLLSDRKPELAAKMLEQLKPKHPKDEFLEYYLSEAYAQLGQPEKALQHIKTAIALYPTDPYFLIRESWIEESLGHGQNAMKILRDVIKMSPSPTAMSYAKNLLQKLEKQRGNLTVRNDSGPDYFLESSKDQARRWNLSKSHSLKVYIGSGDYVPGYREEFRQSVIDSLNIWRDASNGKFDFKLTDHSGDAQILVFFQNEKDDGKDAAVAGRTLPLGGCAFISKAYIFIETEVAGSLMSDDEFKITCIHEIGHALGLDHSKSEKDIMYFASAPRLAVLSQRDKNTLTRLYADDFKMTDWAKLDEEGLEQISQSKSREAIATLEKALSKAPNNEWIPDHLARAYGLAVCDNLLKHSLGDSDELLRKADALSIAPAEREHLQNLKKVIGVLSKLSESERNLVLDEVVSKLKGPANTASSH